MDLDDIFMRSYLNEFNEKEKKKILLSREDREIAEQKRKKLQTIEDFLQKFVDLSIYVNHCHFYTKNTATMQGLEPQLFEFRLVDSSKKWEPGISIWFNHPAEVEIAIPNKPEQGVVVIKVATEHPDAYILEQRFANFQSACEALGKFLGACTTSIGKDPRNYIKEVQNKSKPVKPVNHTFINNVPNSIPLESMDEPEIYEDREEKTETGLSLKKISDLFSRKNKEQKDEE